jgi:leucyl aminopeptidase
MNHFEISNRLNKLKQIVRVVDTYNVTYNVTYNITFDKKYINKFNDIIVSSILTKLHDTIYCYNKKINIILHNIPSHYNNFMNEMTKYKDIVMDPNKNPDTYLKYVLSRVPKNYKVTVFKIGKDKKNKPVKMFPLTKAVGAGSVYNSYFVHIQPKNINNNKKNYYLIGKSITYDSGGMNIKLSEMETMKIDMTGSAILLSVLNLLQSNKFDTNNNIHLIIPIAENMIGNTAIRPGMVVTSMSNKKVEIIDTDAEGRLCLADGIDYVNLYCIKKHNVKNNLIIDIATLTGNASSITNGISSLMMGNNISTDYIKLLIKTGDNIGEYIDYLQLRPEYIGYLQSNVADIANINAKIKSDCILAGTFLNYFCNPLIPWIHMDVASNTFSENMPTCYGINLLYQFLIKS